MLKDIDECFKLFGAPRIDMNLFDIIFYQSSPGVLKVKFTLNKATELYIVSFKILDLEESLKAPFKTRMCGDTLNITIDIYKTPIKTIYEYLVKPEYFKNYDVLLALNVEEGSIEFFNMLKNSIDTEESYKLPELNLD